MLNKLLNLFYKNFYYNCIIKKTRSNIFLTIINRFGEVVISYSTGRIKLLAKKKKRKSVNSLIFIISKLAVLLKKKKIFKLYMLLIPLNLRFLIKNILSLFLKYNIRIKYLKYIKVKSHGFLPRKKKIRRL